MESVPVAWLALKYFLTALIVVLVSEAAKRSDRLGGFLAALPMVTILAMIWLHLDHQPPAKIANHAWYTFWYVLPTLPMFLAFPALLHRFGFWLALVLSAVLVVLCFSVLTLVLKRVGIDLL